MASKRAESHLDSTTDVMDALGGIKAVSALTGSGYKATENWSRAKTFPPCFFLVMSWALHKIGKTAPPELWRQVTPDERQQALAAMIAAQKQRVAA